MSFVRHFEDDGTTVTVDLHGCGVDDALYVIRRMLQEGTRRGRARVEVIHGSSTSAPGERTIKSELQRRLGDGRWSDWSAGHAMDASGGRTSIWLPIGTNADPRRIQRRDVLPR